jgi:hypothetical protein
MSDPEQETAASAKQTPDFLPVPVRARHDGWSVEKQRVFLEVLADSGSAQSAAACVGMSLESAKPCLMSSVLILKFVGS